VQKRIFVSVFSFNQFPMNRYCIIIALICSFAGSIYAQSPTITNFIPAAAPTGSFVTINGNNFTGATAVSFGGTPAASFSVVSNTMIQAVVGNGNSGFVMVTTALGTGSQNGFTYLASPAMTSFSPTSGKEGDTITLTGTYMNSVSSVKFGGVEASNIIILSTTQIKAVVSFGASGTVSATNNFGGSSLPGFTFFPPPLPNFSFTPEQAWAPASIQFIDLSSSVEPIVSWLWNFGDATPSSFIANPTHTYTFPGVYTVSLTVTTASGASEQAFKIIIILPRTEIVLCPGENSLLTTSRAGANYQWQVSTDSVNFTPLTNTVNYSGVNTDSLFISNTPSSFYGRVYRCLVDGNISDELYYLKIQNTWTGSASTAWENAANWSCGLLPDGNTDVVINSGTVILSSNGICRSLTVSPGASFTILPGFVLTITH
jgi:PKD repeat protein